MNDVVINKIQTLQRCIRRAREEYQADPESFESNYTRQDAAILNVVRACETSIDLANYLIRSLKLGVPVSSADSFRLLQVEGIIDSWLTERLQRMTGFRNTVVHQYTKVDIHIVVAVITTDLDELLAFADRVREHLAGAQ
ncbi:MAG: DUF86 domain-containing protein [Bryobacteraceae bacterium]|nr:DUF86 domain-containing protein [Bryobacteraceae bacterium]